MPAIAVIIPVYNRPKEVIRAVKSVFAQNFKDYGVIVIDDGSSVSHDECRELIKKTGNIFLRTEQKGVSHARNVGVKNSDSRYLAFLDSDDEWLPEKLGKQSALLMEKTGQMICHCDEKWIRRGKFVNPRLKHSKPWGDIFAASLPFCTMSPSAVIIERNFFDELGGFDEDLKVCEDYDLWLKASVRTKVSFLAEPLVVKYGGHNDQLSKSVVAIDRYRIFSLLGLIGSPVLTKSQRNLVTLEIVSKAEVVASGAEKRERVRVCSLYTKIASTFSNVSDLCAGDFGSICEMLRAEVKTDLLAWN